MRNSNRREIGLGIIGGGRIGLIRGQIAAKHPIVRWIGVAETRAERAKEVGELIGAQFVTTDFRELLRRSEINAVIVATDEHAHTGPVMAAVERGLDLLIEKPLATSLRESEHVLRAIDDSHVDAVVGYTQRFRRRFLAAKEKVRTGQLGSVTLVTSRAFMNRLVALDNYARTDRPETISPMVISGTHALDIVMWLLEPTNAVEVYARSIDRVLGPIHRGIDATAGVIVMADGSIYHLSVSWALPAVWPGSVYSLEIGIVGTEGVLTIDDTHRDVMIASTIPQQAGYTPDFTRNVDFLESYPPGSLAFGELWGPMREETNSWLSRVAFGNSTPHATAADAHNRLMLSKALDRSARLKRAVPLPLQPEDDDL